MKTFRATKRIFLSWYERQSLISHLQLSQLIFLVCGSTLQAVPNAWKCSSLTKPQSYMQPCVHPATTPKAKATEVGQLREFPSLSHSMNSLWYPYTACHCWSLKSASENPFCVNKIVQLSLPLVTLLPCYSVTLGHCHCTSL